VSKVLLLTSTGETAAEILPSLSLLDHAVRLAPASAGLALSAAGSSSSAADGTQPGAARVGAARADAARADAARVDTVPVGAARADAARADTVPVGAARADAARADSVPVGAARADAARVDAVLVDARRDMVQMRQLCTDLEGIGLPVLAIVGEGGWAAVTTDWGIDDVILHTAGPGEVDARIRLAVGRASQPVADPAQEVRSGELVIDEATYSARFRGAALDLTFKEFELLKFLAQHPRRVFTRSQLLQEVWGYDYFGGTRTVDVHVRRLRAKLGTDNEALIGTVRNVGYKFVPAKPDSRHRAGGSNGRDETQDGSEDDGDGE
jgi:DNA-binding response OmpR family regulator